MGLTASSVYANACDFTPVANAERKRLCAIRYRSHRKQPNYRRWRSQSKNSCAEKQFDRMVNMYCIAWYAADFPFTNEKFFCAESAGRVWDSKKGLAQNLDLVPEAEDAKFDELMERYLSTGFLFCEEVKFVNYMAKFFTYRYRTAALQNCGTGTTKKTMVEMSVRQVRVSVRNKHCARLLAVNLSCCNM